MPPVIRRVPEPLIRQIPRPVVSAIEPIAVPVVQESPAPITRGLRAPVINVPDPTIDYPIIDAPTKEEFEEAVRNENENKTETPGTGNIDTPPIPTTPEVPAQPTVDVAGFEIPIPEPGPLVAAGSLAVVTTAVTLASTIAFAQLKSAAEPLLKTLLQKKKKVKIKAVKPVLHFVSNEDGSTQLIEYGAKGMKVIEGSIDKLEQYLRDQIDIDSFWEYDNKIIIDDVLKDKMTKEGAKRFKRYMVPPKVIAKKLAAKFSI